MDNFKKIVSKFFQTDTASWEMSSQKSYKKWQMENVLIKIVALIISLILIVIVLFVFLLVLPSFWPFNGSLLIYTIGIIFEFIKIIIALLVLTAIPLRLFMGWQSTKRVLSQVPFRWFLLLAFLLSAWTFFPLQHIALINIPIPEEVKKVRYGYSGSNPFQSGIPVVGFYWEVSDEGFINFYTSFFEQRGFDVKVSFGQRDSSSPKYLDHLTVKCKHVTIPQTTVRIYRGIRSPGEDHPRIHIVRWPSFPCLVNLWLKG